PQAAVVLEALGNDRLYVTPESRLFVETPTGVVDAATGQSVETMPPLAGTVSVNNRLRRAISAALAASRLHAQSAAQRLAAARSLQRGADMAMLPVLEKALADENDAQVYAALEVAVATLQLQSTTA